jgi:metal-responsive CopG/Arc/MetJ family transcriptional regulator
MEKKRKVKAFFTINQNLYEKLEQHIEDKLLDKSKLIEFLVKQYLDKQ